MAILPLLQITAIIILVKKLRGSKALVFGVLAIACWILLGLASIFLRSLTAADMVTAGLILSILNYGGWVLFILMIISLPAERRPSGVASPVEAAVESSDQPKSQRTGPDLVSRFGKIGALLGFIVYMIFAGIDRLADSNILSGILWGFISGFIGGGAGAALGFILEKRR
jgi:hypothetical protein